VPGQRRTRRSSFVRFALVVVLWWLLLGGVVLLTVGPDRAASARKNEVVLAPGVTAHIKQPGIRHWPIPVERAAFETYYRGARESDEAAIDEAFEMSEWIEAADGQVVRIVEVVGEAIQVEELDGPFAGRRGWVKPRHLAP
jgi:hypothetical protein